jgi:uncharacterized membrane protein
VTLRERIFSPLVNRELKSEWRGREVSRIEGFSDAVFGFAVTLLIVALEVPRTSGELLETMKGFGAFLITFAILYSIWYKQFVFFRRFGLEDRTTVVLNGALIVVVLFFVYPLKFIAGYFLNRLMGGGKFVTLANGAVVPAVTPADFPLLMAIYGFGFGAVFVVFALLYRHAYRKRDEIGLTPVEQYDTLDSFRTFCWASLIGLIYGTTLLISQLAHLNDNLPVQLLFLVLLLVPLIRMLRLRRTRRTRRDSFLAALSNDPTIVPG